MSRNVTLAETLVNNKLGDPPHLACGDVSFPSNGVNTHGHTFIKLPDTRKCVSNESLMLETSYKYSLLRNGYTLTSKFTASHLDRLS